MYSGLEVLVIQHMMLYNGFSDPFTALSVADLTISAHELIQTTLSARLTRWIDCLFVVLRVAANNFSRCPRLYNVVGSMFQRPFLSYYQPQFTKKSPKDPLS